MSNTIQVSHLNVRQSIFILIIRLLFIEIVINGIIVFANIPLACLDSALRLETFFSFHSLLFFALSFIKTCFSLYVIFSWLNEYYEIETTRIVHKRGFIFRTEQVYDFGYIIKLGIQQGFWGKLFNYGTISLHERFTSKIYYLYLIHNPISTFHTIEKLLPHVGEEQKKIREHLIEKEEGETQ